MTLNDITNLEFRQLVASISSELVPTSPRSFDLCIGEEALPVRVSLHPDQERVIMQAYAFDLATVVGPMREALFPTLLLINQLALEGSPFTIALDSRDFICVTRTQRIDHAEGEAFLDDLDYLLSQALEIRQLTSNLALHGGEMDIDYEESATTVESSFTESISP